MCWTHDRTVPCMDLADDLHQAFAAAPQQRQLLQLNALGNAAANSLSVYNSSCSSNRSWQLQLQHKPLLLLHSTPEIAAADNHSVCSSSSCNSSSRSYHMQLHHKPLLLLSVQDIAPADNQSVYYSSSGNSNRFFCCWAPHKLRMQTSTDPAAAIAAQPQQQNQLNIQHMPQQRTNNNSATTTTTSTTTTTTQHNSLTQLARALVAS